MKIEYALIGKSLMHSRSKEIHEMFGGYRYTLKEIQAEKLGDFIKAKQYKGLNITIPYKEAVIPYCNYMSDEAKRIASVNTIRIDNNGNICGYNTDYFGFKYMLERANIDLNGRKVIILGSGGTSKTAKAVAEDENATRIVIISRNGENNYENIKKYCDYDIIINTTPVGMYPNNYINPIKLEDFPRCRGLIDVIYNPIKTQLIQEAERLNIPHSNGLPMLVAQAAYSREIFTGNCKNADEIEEIIHKCENSMRNLVLIGMPGCGKSLISKILAQKTGRKMIDTDKCIEKKEKSRCANIIREKSEEYFRQIETKIILESAKEIGTIIATGGGSILNDQNCKALMQNGVFIYIRRELNNLATYGRPLSANPKTLKKLFEERELIYSKLADIVINTVEDDIDVMIDEILQYVYK